MDFICLRSFVLVVYGDILVLVCQITVQARTFVSLLTVLVSAVPKREFFRCVGFGMSKYEFLRDATDDFNAINFDFFKKRSLRQLILISV